MKERVFTILYPFCGIGGGALGQLRSRARLLGVEARFRVIGGIDFDQAACNDFEHLVGSPALCRDIAHLTAHELRQLCPEAPDAVFLSPPCKGASGLLSAEKAKSAKYEAMNRLTLDWIETMLEAWDKPPKLVLLENVPRLKQRAASMLKKARALLRAAGYVFHDGFHDCGELGGLAQVRRRFLLVARHADRCPPLLYQPPKRRVRGCGEVLGLLPMPGDPAGGPMHRLPRLSWLNWVRLALIPAGGDWRDLEGVLKDGQARREVFRRHKVQKWGDSADTVAGSGSNGPSAVADPRTQFGNTDRVLGWDQPAGVVTHAPAPSSGAAAVADPRISSLVQGSPVTDNPGPTPPRCAVKWADTTRGSSGPSRATSQSRELDPGNVPASSALDEGSSLIPNAGAYDHGYGVLHWNEPSSTIAGGSQVGQGAYSVADGRVEKDFGGGAFGVTPWTEPSGAVAGESYPSNGRFAAADPRIAQARRDAYGVLHWDEPSGTVTGNGRVAAGPFSVADMRFNCEMRAGTYGVMSWQQAAATITGHCNIGNMKAAVADPRKPPPFTPFIIAADGTWHRPITTLECGALQSFLECVPIERFVLHGASHSAWRERIGNAVPPAAAEAIGDRMLYTLLAAELGAFSLNGGLEVWVERERQEART